MPLADAVAAAAPTLGAAERRVAELVLADPATVAFGTAAEVAAAASTGVGTVVRFAVKAGFDGFAALQQAVRDETAVALRPAARRIRQPAPDDVASASHDAAVAAVDASFAATPARVVQDAARLVASASGVHVVAGEGCDAVARLLVDRLDALRPGVARIAGSPVAVARAVAGVGARDVVVAVDIARYDAWVLDALDALDTVDVGRVVAVTDGPLSPLVRRAAHVLTAATASPGPFDSVVGLVALAEALVVCVAERLRTRAAPRLDAVEAAWEAAGALVDR